MHGQYRKLDLSKVLMLKRQGLPNRQIAQRFGVTQGKVYYFLLRVVRDERSAREMGHTA
jgi:transposase